MSRGKVIQDWMCELPWVQQGSILSSLRGPDAYGFDNIKRVSRWLRGVTQKDADPSNAYMQLENPPSLEEIREEFEFCTIHYAFHLLEGLEIIGYNHPDESVRDIANGYYLGLVSTLNLNPETEEQLDRRLKDG